MLRYSLIICLATAGLCTPAFAQRPQQRKKVGAALLGSVASRDSNATNRRMDVEGAIWEFKVLDNKETNKSKRTKMVGRMRIKQSSVFAVGSVKTTGSPETPAFTDVGQTMNAFDRDGDKKLDMAELSALLAAVRQQDSATVQSDLKSLFSQRVKKAAEQDSGGERIGDLTVNRSSEKTFRFDEDDQHPLSGVVVVKPDTKKRNGVWVGRYDEFVDGKRKKRWRFEMRKIEE